MIREGTLIALALLWGSAALAQPAEDAPPADPAVASDTPARDEAATNETDPDDPPPADPLPPPVDGKPTPDTSIETHRTQFEALTERAIGRTSRPVRYDWRRAAFQLGINGGLPAELNNFDSLRGGIFARLPVGGLLIGTELSYIRVVGSESTEKIALTPYLQPGRPSRIELDFTLTYPLAEGIVTAVPWFIPATQLVLQSHADFRYLIYPGSLEGFTFGDGLAAVFSGSLEDAEVANLEDDRLPGMELDRGRMAFLAGLGADLYFQSGLFLSHRILIALPLLQGATDSKLGFGLELDLSMGLSF